MINQFDSDIKNFNLANGAVYIKADYIEENPRDQILREGKKLGLL